MDNNEDAVPWPVAQMSSEINDLFLDIKQLHACRDCDFFMQVGSGDRFLRFISDAGYRFDFWRSGDSGPYEYLVIRDFWNIDLLKVTRSGQISTPISGPGGGIILTYPGQRPISVDVDRYEWCHLPGELFDLCGDPVQLLPLWRWSRVSNVWTDWGGNWYSSHIKAAIGGGFDMVVRILFVVAGFTWDVLARLVYLALNADFSKDMLAAVDRTYYGVAKAVINSGILYFVAVLGFIVAAWTLFKQGTQEAARTIAWTMLPLGAALFMFYSINKAYSGTKYEEEGEPIVHSTEDNQGLPDFASQDFFGTPSWVHSKTTHAAGLVADGVTQLSLLLTEGRVNHNSYCSAYNHQLERLYLQTLYDKEDFLDGGGLDNSVSYATKNYSPIAISRLWERAYLAGWSQAQFGSPQAAYNGSCLWADYNASAVSAPETMAVWATTCSNTFTPDVGTDRAPSYGTGVRLYGCESDHHAIPQPDSQEQGAQYDYPEQARAWRTFHPDGDDQTKTFLNLISSCGLFSPDAAVATPDGTPGVAPQSFVYAPHPDGSESLTVFVSDDDSYLEASRVGLKNRDGGDADPDHWYNDNWKWLTLDACHAWLTGTKLQSTVDSGGNTNEGTGFGDDAAAEGFAEGLTEGWVIQRANISCQDANHSATAVSNMAIVIADDSFKEVTNPSSIHASAADVCITTGSQYFNRLLHALIVMLVAFSYLFALVGLAVGTALAQILLGLIFMMLPLLLVVAAIPIQSTRSILSKVVKVAIGATLAHAVFLLFLTLMVLIIDVVSTAITNATDPGSTVRVVALALIPFLAKKVVAGIGKQFGFDFTGLKNAVAVTSGLAAGNIGGRGGARGGMAQRYARQMARSTISPYRMRSMMMGGGRINPRAALSGGGGGGFGAGALTGALATAGLGGAVGGALGGVGGGGGGTPHSSGVGVLPRRRTHETPPPPSPQGPFAPPEPGVPEAPGAPGSPPLGGEQAPPPSAPYGPQGDYDIEPAPVSPAYQGLAAGKHFAGRTLGFARRHMLLTTLGVGAAMTGIGLPAMGALYLGAKAGKLITRGPRRLLSNKAKGIYKHQSDKYRELQAVMNGGSAPRARANQEPQYAPRPGQTPGLRQADEGIVADQTGRSDPADPSQAPVGPMGGRVQIPPKNEAASRPSSPPSSEPASRPSPTEPEPLPRQRPQQHIPDAPQPPPRQNVDQPTTRTITPRPGSKGWVVPDRTQRVEGSQRVERTDQRGARINPNRPVQSPTDPPG